MNPRQAHALAAPLARADDDPQIMRQYMTERTHRTGLLLRTILWSRRGEQVAAPDVAEREAVRCLAGVGGDREWWLWNDQAMIGHLRVPVTPAEVEAIPPGMAEHDAGETGPERPRIRR